MAKKCENCDIIAKYKYWNELPPGKHKFFKIMADDFERQLLIPTKFAECFKGELCNWCTLFGPSGNNWRVKLSISEQDSNRVVFSNGWSCFVRDNGIQFRDFLMFRYTDDSSFEVLIFDASGCEREESRFTKNGSTSRTSCTSRFHSEETLEKSSSKDDQTHVSESFAEEVNMPKSRGKKRLSVDDYDEHEIFSEDHKYGESEDCEPSFDMDSEEEANISCLKHSGRLSRSASKSTRGKMSQMYYVSNRRPLEDGEKYRGNVLAEKHRSSAKFPMVLITMKPTYVYNGFNMTIPKNWAAEHMLHKIHEVKLRVPKEQMSWTVGCRWTRTQQCQLRKNWPIFVLENNLEEHDVCAFELIKKDESSNKITMNVYIYRAVDEVIPLSVKRRLV